MFSQTRPSGSPAVRSIVQSRQTFRRSSAVTPGKCRSQIYGHSACYTCIACVTALRPTGPQTQMHALQTWNVAISCSEDMTIGLTCSRKHGISHHSRSLLALTFAKLLILLLAHQRIKLSRSASLDRGDPFFSNIVQTAICHIAVREPRLSTEWRRDLKTAVDRNCSDRVTGPDRTKQLRYDTLPGTITSR